MRTYYCIYVILTSMYKIYYFNATVLLSIIIDCQELITTENAHMLEIKIMNAFLLQLSVIHLVQVDKDV